MRGFLIMALLFLAGLTGCGGEQDAGVADKPRDLTREAVCMIDGMILLDYPGPKGQLFLKNGEVRYFCDTKGLITTLYDPDYKAKIRNAFVQDFAGREWGSYGDRWINIEQAFLVMDGNRFGAMGPTIATFGSREAAEAFAAEHGGRVLAFNELDQKTFDDYQRRVRQQLRELTDISTLSEDGGNTGEIHSHD